jgi:MFS family permease
MGGGLMAADLWGTGWRAVFLFNVPIGLAACLGALRFLPETRSEHSPRLDLIGALLCACGLGLLLYPLIVGRYAGWPNWAMVSMVAGVGMLAMFVFDQRGKSRRRGGPLIEPSLFLIPSFSSGAAIALLLHSTIVAFLFVVALFLQLGLAYSPWHAALVTAPIPAAFLLTSLVSSRLLAKYGAFATMFAGGLLTVIGYGGCIAIALTHHVADGWGLVPALLVVGVGQGLFLPPLLNAVLVSTSKQQAGSAAGIVATCQQVGGAFGVAIVSILYFGTKPAGDPSSASDAAYAFMMAVTYEIAAITLALCLLPILFRENIATVGSSRKEPQA